MASNLRPVPPPLSEPMFNQNGIITPVWGDWFNNVFRYQQTMSGAVADGTYTVGLGTTDGELTIVDGIVTEIQEVVA